MKTYKEIDKKVLMKNGFKFKGSGVWKSFVTLYAHRNAPLIVMQGQLDTEDNTFNYTIWDYNTNSTYSPFYIGSVIPNKVLDEVNMKVDNILNKLRKDGIIVE